jgi:pimeloyl-ACP methyl ester carboxylesterase
MCYRISVIQLLWIAMLLTACSGQVQDHMVDIGTHSLHVTIVGEGSPVVVIDVGLAGRTEEWAAIRDRIAQETAVVTYDRAGYGRSEPGPFPRNAGREADELNALLEAASIPGPYLLVGHSLGGLNMQLFASRHPEEVAGMLLLDPPPLGWIRGEAYTGLLGMAEGMTAEWQALAERGDAQADFFRTIASEHREMLGTSGALAAEIRTFGDIPLHVIAAGIPNPMFGDVAQEYQQYWINESRALAGKSRHGRLIMAWDSTHRLHTDAEELVIESILALL